MASSAQHTVLVVDSDGGAGKEREGLLKDGESEDDKKAEGEGAAVPSHDGKEHVAGGSGGGGGGKEDRNMKKDLMRILQESKGETKRLLLGAFFLLLTAACNQLVPLFAGRMTDAISTSFTGDISGARWGGASSTLT